MSDRKLPPGWSLTPIASLGRIAGGGTPNTSHLRYWQGGTIPWVSPKDMKSLEISDAQDHITPLALAESSTRLVSSGSVLLVIRSGILQHTLPVGIATREVSLNQDMKAIQPHEGLESRFIAYGLLANQTRILNECCKTGTTVQSIEIPQLKRFQLPLAPTAEQTRIADRIDELFTDLAAGVAALERVKRNLTRYRAAVLHAAVTGRLTEAWRKQHGPPDEPGPKLLERIHAERRRQWEERTRAKYEKDGRQLPKGWRDRYPEPSPPKLPSDGSALPELPNGWCWASNDQLVSTITSGSRDWSPYYDRGTGTFIMAGNVRMGWLDRSYRQAVDPPPNHRDRLRSQVEEHDLLVTIVGANTGDVCRVTEPMPEHYICQSVSLMRPVLAETSTWMLTWFTAPTGAQRQFKEFIYGAGRPHLGFEHLEQTLVALPPLAEQSAIVEAVNEELSQIDGLEAEIERGLARASRLRQSILKAAFEGKLVPQNPADEPASVLLERIKQQASEPLPKSDGDGHSVNGTVLRRRGRPPSSRNAAPDAAATLTVSTPAKTMRSRKVQKR